MRRRRPRLRSAAVGTLLASSIGTARHLKANAFPYFRWAWMSLVGKPSACLHIVIDGQELTEQTRRSETVRSSLNVFLYDRPELRSEQN